MRLSILAAVASFACWLGLVFTIPDDVKLSSMATIHVIMQAVLGALILCFLGWMRYCTTNLIWEQRIMWVFVLVILGIIGGLVLQHSGSTPLAHACIASAAVDFLVCVLAIVKLYFLFSHHSLEGYARV